MPLDAIERDSMRQDVQLYNRVFIYKYVIIYAQSLIATTSLITYGSWVHIQPGQPIYLSKSLHYNMSNL